MNEPQISLHLYKSGVDSPSVYLRGWRLVLARLAWVLYFAASLTMVVILTFQSIRLFLYTEEMVRGYLLFNDILSFRNYFFTVMAVRALVLILNFLVSAIVFWRRSNEWVAILTAIMLVCLPYTFDFWGIDFWMYSPPWDLILEAILAILLMSGILTLIWLVFIFPDGRFVPQRLKPLVVLLMVALFLVLFSSGGFEEEWIWGVIVVLMLSLIWIAGAGQVYRYRNLSNASQRQQSNWFLISFLFLGIFLSVITLASFLLGEQTNRAWYQFLSMVLETMIVLIIPLSIGFAVLRYRLWDIDLIIRRTMVYGGLTITLLVIYFGVVVGLQTVFVAISGQQSAIAIVISTLIIAALFNPLRQRIQSDIDRRFFRRRYNAQQTLAEFSASLRDEVDIEVLQGRLVAVIEKSMQPERVSLLELPLGSSDRFGSKSGDRKPDE